MTRLSDVECPYCGSDLHYDIYSDTVKCNKCGKKFAVTDEGIYEYKDLEVKCPVCNGTGNRDCIGIESVEVRGRLKTYEMYVEACTGDGKCQVSCFPPKDDIIANHCHHGTCVWCNGTGRYHGECRFCQGSGKCRFCHGTGVCKFCGGSGEVRCRACRGKGYQK